MRILVVEDNLVNQRVIMHILKRGNHSVDVACDGVEAVERASEHPYDIILMDCQMPRMDGITATRLIRQNSSRNGRTAIVAVTANIFPEDRARCLEAGMNDHLGKPISKELLMHTLERWGPSSTSQPLPQHTM